MTWPGYERYLPPGRIDASGRVRGAEQPSKYRNRKTTVDGETFDSAKEARRWQELLLLQKAGRITGLTRQMPWTLEVHGQVICEYRPDFSYCESGQVVVEDVKSEATRKLPVYRLKRKLMKAIHGIEIRET